MFGLLAEGHECLLDLEVSVECWLPHLQVTPAIAAEHVLALIAHDIDQVFEVVLIFNFDRFFAFWSVNWPRIANFIHFHFCEFFFGWLRIPKSHQTQIQHTESHRKHGRTEQNKPVILPAQFLHVAHYLTLAALYLKEIKKISWLRIQVRPFCRRWWIAGFFVFEVLSYL